MRGMLKMPQYYEYELAKAAHKLVTEMLKLKPDETIVITADTESDPELLMQRLLRPSP